jgi:hypothetical protein
VHAPPPLGLTRNHWVGVTQAATALGSRRPPAIRSCVAVGNLCAVRSLRALIAGLATILTLVSGTTSVTAAPAWAPAATAPVHPGVQVRTEVGQCTSNFVFTEGSSVYIGMAAHCAGVGGPTDVDGCDTDSLPLGSPVEVTGASRLGTLAYSSWLTMQEVGESDPEACRHNDLALVELDPADVSRVNPSIPHWGGPVGLGGRTTLGSKVYSYGNSSLRLGLDLLNPKVGVSLGDSGEGWNHDVLTLTPGIPGDSGSAFLDSRGRALGVLSTLVILPIPASNGVGDLRRELTYMHTHTGVDAVLALGTEPFDASRLPPAPSAATGNIRPLT